MRPTVRRTDSGRASLRLLGAVFLLLLAGVSLESLSPTVHLAGSIAVALWIAIWWFTSRAAVVHPPRSIVIPAAGLLILELISLLWTPFPAPAYRSLVEAILIGAVFLMVLNSIRTGWQSRNWQDALVIIGLALTFLELLLLSAWLRGWHSVGGAQPWLPPIGYRSSGLLLGHANVLAGLINLILPLLLVRAVVNWSRPTGKLLAVPIAFLLLSLFLTSSRAGWMSGLFGIVITLGLIALAFVGDELSPSLRQLAGRVRLWQIAAGTAVALVIGMAAYWQVSRTGHQPLAGARTPVWAASLQIIRQEPLLGHGLRSSPVSYASLPYEHKEEDIPHAHNLFLQVGTEAGLVGVALLVALLWGATRAGWMQWQSSDAAGRISMAAYGGAGAAFLSHALFDFLLGPPFYALASAVLLGLLIGGGQDRSVIGMSDDRVARFAVALGPLAAALLLVLTQAGAWSYWKGTLAAREYRWTAASVHLCAAQARNPAEPVAASSCGLAQQIAALESDERPDDAAVSNVLQLAASLDPAWGFHWGNLGAAELAAGHHSGGTSALERSLQVYPVSPDLLLTRGLAAERSGDQDAAATFYREALELNPWTWYSAYLQAEPHRLEGFEPEPLADSLPAGESWAWRARLAIDEGDLSAAEDALQTASNQGAQRFRIAALRAEIAMLSGDPDEALAHARVAEFINPDHIAAREILAVVLAARDSPEAQDALVRAAESLVFQSRSRRYFSSAHGRLGLTTDISPNLVLGHLSDRLLRMVWAALANGGQDLDQVERLILELLIDHCACRLETSGDDNIR